MLSCGVPAPRPDAGSETAAVRQETEGEEMKAYRRLLAGDFSGIEDESDRSACEYDYERSLKPGNGKSVWKYVIADLNHDGTNELFIQLCPYPYDDPVAGQYYNSFDCDTDFISVPGFCRFSRKSALFTYQGGHPVVSLDDTDDAFYDVLLKGGKVLFVAHSSVSSEIFLGNLDSALYQITEKSYRKLTIDYNIQEKEWYDFLLRDTKYPENIEGVYFIFRNYKNDEPDGEPVPMSRQEWESMERMIDSLVIPDSEWRSNAYFNPLPQLP